MGSRSVVKGLSWLSLSALFLPQGSVALRAGFVAGLRQSTFASQSAHIYAGAQSPVSSEKRFPGIRKALFTMRGGSTELPHVSTTWLKENLGSVKVLDASW